MRAVVGRDAAVGLKAVEAAVEIKQQRVEIHPLQLLRLQRSAVAERQLVHLVLSEPDCVRWRCWKFSAECWSG